MDLKAIMEWMEKNKDSDDVKALINHVTPSVEVTEDMVLSFIESEKGKKLMQPRLDTYFHKGLETWKDKTLPSIIESEISKRNPKETDEQKKLRALESDLQREKHARRVESCKNVITSILAESGIPVNMASYLVHNSDVTDEEGCMGVITESAKKFVSEYQAAVTGGIEKALAEKGRTPVHTSNSKPLEEQISLALQAGKIEESIKLKTQLMMQKASGGN
jgi:hypothetical protein